MSCISPDGTPSESGAKMLRSLESGAKIPENVAEDTGFPLFRVRSGLRELSEAGFVIRKDERYAISQKGIELLHKSN